MVKRLSCLPSKQAAGVRLPFGVLLLITYFLKFYFSLTYELAHHTYPVSKSAATTFSSLSILHRDIDHSFLFPRSSNCHDHNWPITIWRIGRLSSSRVDRHIWFKAYTPTYARKIFSAVSNGSRSTHWAWAWSNQLLERCRAVTLSQVSGTL